MTEKRIEHRGRIIRDEIRTKATPRQVWDAWTDPKKIAQWFVDKASGEAKAGGTMTWEFEKFAYVIPYEVKAADPEEYFVLQWNPPEGNPGILEIFIEREGGETVMRLVNSGFREGDEWDAEYEGTVSGWQMSLAILKNYLENYFGQPKTQVLVIRPATFDMKNILPYFREPALLAKWLTTSGAIGKPGEPCNLVLRDDGRVTGHVLAVTRSEAAISWPEMRGTLELKAFPMGPTQKMVGIRGFFWGREAARVKEVESQMAPAVERLVAVLSTTTRSQGQAEAQTETGAAASKTGTRTIVKEIEIAAPVNAVWKALTDSQELARWFPLDARVKPGLGGSVFLSWGPDCEGEARITAWEPGHRLATEDPSGAVTVEWTIEARGGKTLVRVVNSGFTTGTAAEDEMFDSTDYGWGFMLLNLKHYLERHSGTPRQVAWPRKKISVSREQAYERIAGTHGLFAGPGPAQLLPGSAYLAQTEWCDRYSGRVEFVVPPRGFCVTVKELNDALLWLTIEGVPGKHEVQLWLSAYAIPQHQVNEFAKHGAELLERLFSEQAISQKSAK